MCADELRDICPRATGAARRSSARAARSPTSPAFISRVRAFAPRRRARDARAARRARAHPRHARSDMSPEERRSVPGLNPGRADIIVAGLAVAAEVLARLDAASSSCRATAFAKGCCSRRRACCRSSPTRARRASARCASSPSAATTRSRTRCMCRGSRCGCSTRSARGSAATPDDRQMLADAALLHDVGYHINYERHHKHSYHLILHADLLGMTPAEQVVIANVARYHRGAPPKKEHPQLRLARQAAARAGQAARRRCSASPTDSTAATSARSSDLKVRWLQRAHSHHAGPAQRAPADAARDVGREPQVGAAREGRGRAGGDRRAGRRDVRERDDDTAASQSDASGALSRPSVRTASTLRRVVSCRSESREPASRRPRGSLLRTHPSRLELPRLPVVGAGTCRAARAAARAAPGPPPARPPRRGGRSCAASSRPSRCSTPRSPPFAK